MAIDELKLKVENSMVEDKTSLHNHILKIQVKKARTLDKLRQLHSVEDVLWKALKENLEISYKELKVAYSKPFIFEGPF